MPANPQVTDEMVEKALDAWLASPSEDTLASIRAALTAALADHVVVPREPSQGRYRATVTVEQISPTDSVTITIGSIFRIDAAEWPEVVNGVATMLKSFTSISKEG